MYWIIHQDVRKKCDKCRHKSKKPTFLGKKEVGLFYHTQNVHFLCSSIMVQLPSNKVSK